MIRLSTGFRNLILGTDAFKDIFENGVIHIYTGSQPISANNAVTGTLLGRVTRDGGSFNFGDPDNGLQFDEPSEGIIAKVPGHIWRFTGLTNGVAGWGRLMGNALDNLGSSETLPRIDFSIGQSGADLNLNNTNVAEGASNTFDVFQFRLPSQ